MWCMGMFDLGHSSEQEVGSESLEAVRMAQPVVSVLTQTFV